MPDSKRLGPDTPQAGIFALGTSSHAYLHFDLVYPNQVEALISAIATIREPRRTTRGMNFVIGFRPELWHIIAPDEFPQNVESFQPIVDAEGFRMPATQHDVLVWLSGSAYDVVFDMARSVIRNMAGTASLQEETSSWFYRHDRDLTGFIDGSEKPSLMEAAIDALLPPETPGAAGSILLLQKWRHKTLDWESRPEDQQERVMGRTKGESTKLGNKAPDSHVARTDQDKFGKIFRRNMPYGNVEEHGTMFVGFSAEQSRLSRMLYSMAGTIDGTRDALTRFTEPMTGSNYFVPSVQALLSLRKG